MNNSISESYNRVTKIMNFFGLWPGSKPSLFYTLRSYMLYFVFMVLSTLLTAINLVIQGDQDFIQLYFIAIFVSESVFSTLKLFPFITNGEKMKTCINFFEHPRFVPINDKEKKMTQECVQLCRKICEVYIYGVSVSCILWVLPKLFSKSPKLPLELWLPYDVNKSPTIFYSTFTFLSMAGFYNGLAAITDAMIGTLSYHATTRLKILKHNLKILYKWGGEENLSLEEVYQILKRCVNQHNDVFCFLSEFEKRFSWYMFCQISGSTLCLCFCFSGLITVDPMSIDGVKFFIFYFVVMFQIFFYCFFGTLLFEENDDFMNSVCSGPWYRYDIRIRTILIIMMERAKRPAIITAGKIVNLTLATFTSLLKTSYSLFTVLKNFQ